MELGLEQHLRKLLFQTGAFTTAWSWVLVYYGTWHLLAGESPLQGQAGLGAHAEREGMLLLLAPYLAVCASAAVLLTQLKAAPGPMTGAIVAAVEFFPSPIFTATLLAFLGRFSSGFALREDLGDNDLLTPSSAARRKQVLLEEGWPRDRAIGGGEF